MIIKSVQEMIDLGKEYSKKNKKILLYGDLGAGKTHFIKGFASGLGIEPDLVQSPTYTYLNIYENKILHIDMYRLESFESLIEKGILEMISDFDYVCIEWPKFEENYIDKTWQKIKIDKIDPQTREIHIG